AVERFAPREVNIDGLLQGVNGDRKLLGELIEVFIADAPRLMSRIQRAVARQDAGRLREAAHALKGAVGNFDQGAAFETLRRLEIMGRENQVSDANAVFRKARKEIAHLTRSLRNSKMQFMKVPRYSRTKT